MSGGEHGDAWTYPNPAPDSNPASRVYVAALADPRVVIHDQFGACIPLQHGTVSDIYPVAEMHVTWIEDQDAFFDHDAVPERAKGVECEAPAAM